MFTDRRDGGEKLALALKAYRHDKDVLVLAIPKGGVETAYYVAAYLAAPLSVIIARKLGHPLNPEAAIGAIAEEGGKYLDPRAAAGISFAVLRSMMEREQQTIRQRIAVLREGQLLPDMHGKTVILVDDGIATGATVMASIATCRQHHPAKLVVATPVCSLSTKQQLESLADQVVILEIPDNYWAVSQVYEHFSDFPEDQAIQLLQKSKRNMVAAG